MNLSLFRPAYHTTTLQNPVDALFESFLSGARTHSANTSISPRVDIYDEGKTLVVEAEMPGVKKSDVSVNLERGVLTLKAEKKSSREEKSKDYYLGERSVGTYERSFRVTDDIDPDSIKASFEDGVLHITMTRKAEAAGKKIDIA